MLRYAAILATTMLVAPSASHAATIIDTACGSNCGDVVGTRSSLRSAWQAFQDMGTTSFLGSSFNGGTIDEGMLLQGASVMGASEVDRLLRSGVSRDDSLGSRLLSAFGAGQGTDVSSVLSSFASNSRAGGSGGGTFLASMAGDEGGISNLLAGATDPGMGNTPACDPAIGKAMSQSSKEYAKTVMRSSTEGQYAFSRMGGQPLSGKASGGMFGGSCLEKFMQGNMDLFFKAPNLSQLLSSVSQSFGGGSGAGGSACDKAESLIEQVTGSFPDGVFDAGASGFMPTQAGESDGLPAGFWSGSTLEKPRSAELQPISLSSIVR